MSKAMARTKRRKSASPVKARASVELFREFFTARLTASAAAWSVRMSTFTVTAETAQTCPHEPASLRSVPAAWTDADDMAVQRLKEGFLADPQVKRLVQQIADRQQKHNP